MVVEPGTGGTAAAQQEALNTGIKSLKQ